MFEGIPGSKQSDRVFPITSIACKFIFTYMAYYNFKVFPVLTEDEKAE